MSREPRAMLMKSIIALGVLSLALVSSFRAQERNTSKSASPSQDASDAAPFATLPPGPMAEKATNACTECHEARIILQQRLSKAAWTKEVDKMIKWGAVVDPADHDALVDYLSTNFSPDQPPYEPPRTSGQKSGPAKTSR
jgi:hypothetical protein